MRAILEDDSDPTEMSLVFANKTKQDILLTRRLHALAEASRER